MRERKYKRKDMNAKPPMGVIIPFIRTENQALGILYHMKCRETEIGFGYLLFDRDVHKEEYEKIQKEFFDLVIVNKWLENNIRQLYINEEYDINSEVDLILNSARVFEWETHWFYPYLKQKDVWEYIDGKESKKA